MNADTIVALSILIPVLVNAYLALRNHKELKEVKHLVNSQLDQVMERLDIRTLERDVAVGERDTERRERE